MEPTPASGEKTANIPSASRISFIKSADFLWRALAIWDLLGRSPRTLKEMGELLELRKEEIQNPLRRLAAAGVVEVDGKSLEGNKRSYRWRRVEGVTFAPEDRPVLTQGLRPNTALQTATSADHPPIQ